MNWSREISADLNIRLVDISDIHPGYLQALNDPGRIKYMHVGGRPKETEESLTRYVTRSREHHAEYLFGLFHKNELIATSRTHDIDQRTGRAHIGVLVFSSRYEGKGYATQLVRAVCDFLQDHFNISNIYAGIMADNTASKRCFEKAGFRFQAINPDYSDFVCETWVKN
jgi:RimJ/RimL family protein N-acetyltransferase